MAVEYLKRATKTSATGENETRKIVADMLDEIEQGGEDVARAYGEKLDGWDRDIKVGSGEIEAAAQQVPDQLKDDLKFAYERVQLFAEKQKDSMQAFETELSPGLWAGQRLIPVDTAGCYVPGGRYAHVASAIMSITTAKVAGVENVIACSAPSQARRMSSRVASL